MDVSVILPTFNREATLPRALRSVLAQKGASFEVLVVDDGSTDGTATSFERRRGVSAPLRTEANPQVRYFFQPNRGPAAARNLGILNARSEFMAFLDSDDEWLPGKLIAQLRFFEEHPDFLVVQTEEVWIRNGKRVNPMKKHQKLGGWILEPSLRLSIVSPSAVMMRREFFDEVGLFDESLPACEDYDLWLRASARFPFGLIEKSYVIRYGGHSDQRSRQFPVMDRFRIQAIRKLLDSPLLNPEQRESALQELRRKCAIVSRGAAKRGKIGEGRFYAELAEKIDATPPPALILPPLLGGEPACRQAGREGRGVGTS